MSDAPAAGRSPVPYDFSRPPNLPSSHAAALAITHEEMTRMFSAALTQRIRAAVTFDPQGIEQHAWASYAGTLPSPSVLATVALNPGYGTVLIEIDVVTALAVVDLMAGGEGAVQARRRLTELERQNVNLVLRWAVEALEETVGSLIAADEPVDAQLVAIEQNPELVSFTGPSEAVAVMSYTMQVRGIRPVEGTMSIVYPQSLINVALQGLDHRVRSAGDGSRYSAAEQQRRLLGSVGFAVAPLVFTLNPTEVAAADIANLQVGDVLTLDHRGGAPVIAWVEGEPVGSGHMGQTGRRVGVRMLGPVHRGRIVAGELVPVDSTYDVDAGELDLTPPEDPPPASDGSADSSAETRTGGSDLRTDVVPSREPIDLI